MGFLKFEFQAWISSFWVSFHWSYVLWGYLELAEYQVKRFITFFHNFYKTLQLIFDMFENMRGSYPLFDMVHI